MVKFVGVFDTVKALSDENRLDISFNDSIQHFRHALALNEDRKVMDPEYVFPNSSTPAAELSERSNVQAWFVGAHLDMGGSAEKDGLALYPLQWILDESESKGLVLEFSQLNHDWAKIDDPLRVVFPSSKSDSKGPEIWTFKTENGVKVRMQDLHKVHQCEVYKGRYSIKVNKREGFYGRRQAREPFNDDPDVLLKGYCPSGVSYFAVFTKTLADREKPPKGQSYIHRFINSWTNL